MPSSERSAVFSRYRRASEGQCGFAPSERLTWNLRLYLDPSGELVGHAYRVIDFSRYDFEEIFSQFTDGALPGVGAP